MIRRPPRSTRTDTLLPYTTLFRSTVAVFDISQAKSKQWSQEFRLQSAFDGPFNFSLGANYTRFKTLNDYYVMSNMFTALARSEEHTSELQSLMRISYAVFCLKKKHHSTTTSY